MINRRIHIIGFLALILISFNLVAQGRLSAIPEKRSILIGESVKLILQFQVPVASVKNLSPYKNSGWVDTIPHFELVDRGKIDSATEGNNRIYRQELIITSYDSGKWVISPISLRLGKKAFRADTFSINVNYSTEVAKPDYHDIKDILQVEPPSTAHWYWIIGSLIVVGAALAYYFLRKKKPVLAAPAKKVSKLNPFEEAIQSLQDLSRQPLVENSDVKNYFVKLNDILRIYLQRKYNLATMEKTNEELIMQLRSTPLPKEEFTKLAQALRLNDFVKFAKYIPQADEREENTSVIKQSIIKLEELSKDNDRKLATSVSTSGSSTLTNNQKAN